MPTMSNRIFLSLVAALLCLTVTSVCSYGPYVEEYGPREESLRQVRRCPTCPADCPESLASPWYGSPTVYGQPGPFYKATNENVKGLPQQASYSASQPHPRDSVGPGFYGNPHYINPYENSRCRCSHGRCNARSPRSGNASPEPVITVPPTKHEQVPFDSMESRGLSPYGYPRFSAASFVPETYQEIDSFGVIPTENHRVSRHYGHAYKQMISDRTIDQEESSGSNPSNWNPSDLSLPQQPERTMYDGRLKAVETPSRKKVFVVYRADADHTIDDDDLDRSLIPTSRQQQQQQHHHDGSTDSSRTDDSTSAPPNNPMSDFQLEQVVRRAIAAATRQNTREEELYSRNQHTREIDYNEHQRNPEESYNTAARPYNDDLYRRFNAEEAIDRQEKRKQYIAAFPPSELVYTPTMRHYNPYVLPEDYSQNIPSQSISEQSNHQRYNAAWEAQQIADKALNVAADDIGEYTSQIGQQQQQQPTTILEELREISRQQQEQEKEEDENNEQEKKKSFETVQDLMPNKRETDLEALLPPPINYRTHSRTTDSTSYPGGKENEQVESAQQRDKGNRMLEIMTEKEENGPPIAINPDLIEDMEIPPIEGSEVELQLSFESSDNTTPSPTN